MSADFAEELLHPGFDQSQFRLAFRDHPVGVSDLLEGLGSFLAVLLALGIEFRVDAVELVVTIPDFTGDLVPVDLQRIEFATELDHADSGFFEDIGIFPMLFLENFKLGLEAIVKSADYAGVGNHAVTVPGESLKLRQELDPVLFEAILFGGLFFKKCVTSLVGDGKDFLGLVEILSQPLAFGVESTEVPIFNPEFLHVFDIFPNALAEDLLGFTQQVGFGSGISQTSLTSADAEGLRHAGNDILRGRHEWAISRRVASSS